MKFRNHTLPNGLQVIAECNDEAHSMALGFFVKTGSRDETDAIAGTSHFLEHMMFKGTPTRSADDVNREFDEMGAHYNAFTSEDSTVYHAAVLPEYQDRTVELLADILRPSLREDDFEMEKKVILEEIQMYEDQPPFGADERCRAAFYGSHPLGRSVLGTPESISALPVDAMRDYFQRRYGPESIVLAAAGRVDFDALVKQTERCCGGWASANGQRDIRPATPEHGFQFVHKPIATQQYTLQLSDAPSACDTSSRFAAKLLATVLGDDSGSRLYWELVDPGLAEHATLHHYEYEDSGVMMTYMSCTPELAAENLQRAYDVYRQAESDGITEEELQQAKSKLLSRIVLVSERPRGRLFGVGTEWVYRQEYCSIDDDLRQVTEVSLDEVNALLVQYPLSKSNTITIGPLAKVKQPDGGGNGQKG